MDASQYKDYVLVLLFVKCVKYAGQKDALLDVPKGGRFADMVALKGDKEIGDKMNKIIGGLTEANELKGVIEVADSLVRASGVGFRRLIFPHLAPDTWHLLFRYLLLHRLPPLQPGVFFARAA